MLKQIFDTTAAALGVLVLAPLLLGIALAIKLTSPGPILHRAQRVGLNGRIFTLYKFRSMVINAERLGAGITARDDPRVTRPGRFLRRTKLDELPQLINVLKGEMSLVGPRPEDARYVALYTLEQRRVLSVRPGITSWASIQFRHEEQLLGVENVDEVYRLQVMPQKLALELAYLERRTFGLDMLILARTVQALFQ